jgi:transcriptional regulator with XRE-family HTH domain
MKSSALNQRRMQGTDFGPLLKEWRARKGISQFSLALASNVSQRHISFLESGRATPSREMIVRITTELDVPLRYRNELLLSAGFAPLYSENNWQAPDLAPIRRAVELILAQQEPYPAVVLDRLWNIKLANAGATALFQRLSRHKPVTNILTAVFDASSLRPVIDNWDALASHLRLRLRQESEVHGRSELFAQLVEEVKRLDPTYEAAPVSAPAMSDPMIWISLRSGGFHARLFSTITTLGTPHDITLQELRIESFFPLDDASARQLKALSSGKASTGRKKASPTTL